MNSEGRRMGGGEILRPGSPVPLMKGSASLRMEQLRIFQTAAAYEGGSRIERRRSMFECGLPVVAEKYFGGDCESSTLDPTSPSLEEWLMLQADKCVSRGSSMSSASAKVSSLRLKRTSYIFNRAGIPEEQKGLSFDACDDISDDDGSIVSSDSDSDVEDEDESYD